MQLAVVSRGEAEGANRRAPMMKTSNDSKFLKQRPRSWVVAATHFLLSLLSHLFALECYEGVAHFKLGGGG